MGFLENVSLVNRIKVFLNLSTNSKNDDLLLNTGSNLLNNDSLLFLLDMISVLLGSAILRQILSGFLNELLSTLDGEIKDFLKLNNNSQLGSTTNSGFNLTIPMSLLDFNDQFKIDPNSIEGSKNYKSGSFNSQFHNNVLNGNNSDIFFGFINISYSSAINAINVGVNPQGNNEEFLNTLLDSMKIIDPVVIIDMVLDSLFNTTSKKKSISGIKNELKINKILSNILQEKEENEVFSVEIEDASFYEVESKKIKSGLMVLDFGCGNENMSLDKDFLNQNFSNPILHLEAALNSALTNSGIPLNPAINDNFYKDSSNKLLQNVIKAVILAPQMIIYLLIRTLLLNGKTPIPNNPTELLSLMFALIKLIICQIKNKFIAYVFNIFKRELLRIILPVLKLIIKEKILSYKKILLSLVKK